MAEQVETRETVVVEHDSDNGTEEHRSNNLGWLIALIILVLLAMVFLFGFSPFNGDTSSSGSGSSTTNVDVPTAQ